MNDDNKVVVRCTRCVDIVGPGTPSRRVPCTICGRKVWLSDVTVQMALKHYPGFEVEATCMKCPILDHEVKITNLPEDVALLRALGDSDEIIAYKFAVADVTGGVGTLEESEDEMRAFPEGLKAKAFPAALRRAQKLVAITRQRSN